MQGLIPLIIRVRENADGENVQVTFSDPRHLIVGSKNNLVKSFAFQLVRSSFPLQKVSRKEVERCSMNTPVTVVLYLMPLLTALSPRFRTLQ